MTPACERSLSRRLERAALGMFALVALLLVAREGRAEETELDYGKGMFELRVQTASNATSGALVSSESTSGAYYSSVSEGLVIQSVLGGGFFVTPALELGIDLTEFFFIDDSSDTGPRANMYGLAPFVRVVSGVKDWGPGVFAEASPAFFLYTLDEVNHAGILNLSLWAGGHFPLGAAPVAFVVGPTISRVDDVENFGEGSFLIGLKLGLSLYFPRNKPAAAPTAAQP